MDHSADGPPDRFAVTPGRGDREEILRVLPRLASLGARRLLLREKALPAAARRQLARAVAPECRALGIELWISEDLALAREIGAAGVHLSERSASPLSIRAQAGAQLGIGVSLHRPIGPIGRSAEELAVCDHAFLGPVFATPSKPDHAPLGITGFLELAAAIPVPVYAIGGIGPAELESLAAAGVRRIAAIRLFFGAASQAAS